MALPAGVTLVTNIRGPRGPEGPRGTFAGAEAVSVAPSAPAEVVMYGPEDAKQVRFYIPRGLDGGTAVDDDAAVAGFVGTPGTETRNSLSLVSAPVGLGKSVADFGVAADATPAANTAAFRAAIDWLGTNPFGVRALFIPPLPPEQSYLIDDQITNNVPGATIYGSGEQSRIKQTVMPKGVFRAVAANQTYRDFGVVGPDDRAWPEGTVEDQHEALHNAGVSFLSGSDGGVAEGITGRDIAQVVNAWAVDTTTGAYAGQNIYGLTVRRIRASGVWCAVYIREVDNLTVDDVSGSYQYLWPAASGTAAVEGTFAAGPHLVYVTSSLVAESPRPLRGVRGSNWRAKDGKSAAFAIKRVVGGVFDGLVADRCMGLLDVNFNDGVVINAPVSMDDIRPYDSAGGVIQSDSNVNLVIESPYISLAAGEGPRSIRISANDNRVVIRNPTVVTRHATAQTDPAFSTFDMRGTNCRIENPTVRMEGVAPRDLITIAGTGNVLVNPAGEGLARAVKVSSAAVGARIESYDPSRISRLDTTYPTLDVTDGGKVLLAPSPYPDAVVWDRQDFATADWAWALTGSGHPLTRTGVWEVDKTSGRVKYVTPGPSARYASADAGDQNVEVVADVWLATMDAGGDGAIPPWVGHTLRFVSSTNNVHVEMRASGVQVRHRNGEATDLIASETSTYDTGRRYVLRSVVIGNRIQVFVDNVKVIDATIPPEVMTANGTAKSHGYAGRQNLAGRFANLRITKLS